MTHTLIIPGSLPGLNEYTDANRGHKYRGNSLKKQTEQMIIILAKNQLNTPVFMTYASL